MEVLTKHWKSYPTLQMLAWMVAVRHGDIKAPAPVRNETEQKEGIVFENENDGALLSLALGAWRR